MAIAVQLDFAGATLDQYDEVVKLMGMTPGEPSGTNGGLFHFVIGTDTGIRIIDVWESKNQFEEFIGAHVMPAVAQAGITSPPEIQFFDVHNYFTA